MKQFLPVAVAAILFLFARTTQAQNAGITLGANFGTGFVSSKQQVYLATDFVDIEMDVTMMFGAQIKFRFNSVVSLVLNPSYERTKFSATQTYFGDFYSYRLNSESLIVPVMFRLSSRGEIGYFGNIGIVQSLQVNNLEKYTVNGVEDNLIDYYGTTFLRTGFAFGAGMQFELGEGFWASGEVRDYYMFESPGDIFSFQNNGDNSQNKNAIYLLIGFHYAFGY